MSIDWSVISESRMLGFGSAVLPSNEDSDMLQRFFHTDASKTLGMQRLLLGAVMLPHGAQKLLGWFGATASTER
jgi:hypothetical protein